MLSLLSCSVSHLARLGVFASAELWATVQPSSSVLRSRCCVLMLRCAAWGCDSLFQLMGLKTELASIKTSHTQELQRLRLDLESERCAETTSERTLFSRDAKRTRLTAPTIVSTWLHRSFLRLLDAECVFACEGTSGTCRNLYTVRSYLCLGELTGACLSAGKVSTGLA